MLVLIMTVCSLSAPDRCQEARLQFAGDQGELSLMQCVASSQMQIAAWAAEHPGVRVARWRCAYPEREGAHI